ncbi:MAG TPA: hypothetical protein VLI92_00045 [Candidatus Saccharimonadales bacterium]|nr:hypothetical protein [Candidatus Saccharimonadales bacterium]
MPATEFTAKLDALEAQPDRNKERQDLPRLVAEIKDRDLTAKSHENIMDIYEHVPHKERLQLAKNLVEDALAKTNNTGASISKMQMLWRDQKPDVSVARPQGAPDVYVRQVYKQPYERPRTALQKYVTDKISGYRPKEPIPTDEVSIYVRLNNSTEPDKDTFVVYQGRTNNGQVSLAPELPGEQKALITNGAKLDQLFNPENKKHVARFARGEMSIKWMDAGPSDYDKEFKKERGVSPAEYWDQKDWKYDNDYLPAVKEKSRQVELQRSELFEALGGKYTQALEQAQQRAQEIGPAVVANVAAEKVRRESVIERSPVGRLGRAFFEYSSSGRDPAALERCITIATPMFGKTMSREEIIALIERNSP